MTRIDFYVLQDQTADASERFACRLGLKALGSASRVHVHVNDSDTANAVDELMWDYPMHRFLPHEVLRGSRCSSPLHIGCGDPQFGEGLLINLASEVPAFFGRFDRVAEIIVGATRTIGRERYKFYRDRGYPLHHHELDNWEK